MKSNNDKPNENTQSTISGLTKENATKSNAIEIPQITLPKGGGALKSVDEKFSVNAANGTASFSIPLPLSAGRQGFAPALALGYNSGGGNSLFGLGWSVDFPAIQRRTDKRLPRYRYDLPIDVENSADTEGSDTFQFSGVEDLVPMLEADAEGKWQPIGLKLPSGMVIRRFRPRIEGSFSRIEQIHHPTRGMYWRVTTKENVTTFFGYSHTHRVSDPHSMHRVFQWLPEISFDDKGNVIVFEFKNEDLKGISKTLAHERHRRDAADKPLFTNRHLKKVRYGNHRPVFMDNAKPFEPPIIANDALFFFHLAFDYGEHGLFDADTPSVQVHFSEQNDWAFNRHDAFSDYRAGFERRTYRLCQRVLMFHQFPELADGQPCLVRSLDFNYQTEQDFIDKNLPTRSEVTYLKSIRQSGYIQTAPNTYSRQSLPPMRFDYAELRWNRTVKTVSREALSGAPVGTAQSGYQFADLYGEGISGILIEQSEGLFFKKNLGVTDGTLHFARPKMVSPKPNFSGLSNGLLQLQDLSADGRKQLVVNSLEMKGFFNLKNTDDENTLLWQGFHPFSNNLNIDFKDPNLKFLDLNGDGKPDVLISENEVFTWYASAGTEGYEKAERTFKPLDDNRRAQLIFNDAKQTFFTADMSGDGLTDIVRIRNGEVTYFPNLGYGRFGAKVTMSHAPIFDAPDAFNPAYLQLADVSGTGATDIVYLGKNTFRAYLNLSGNAWSAAMDYTPFCSAEQPNQVSVMDLLGTGTACIVWSSPLPANASAPIRYVDLMGSQKPHIMTHYSNGMGKETTMTYRSSTHFYLKDQAEGRRWITRLPFPVHCVEQVETREHISQVRFTQHYAYHNGYYDHAEREFRGFGMVEQWDTENYDNFSKTVAGNIVEKPLHQKAVLTKTWFHTGVFMGRERILDLFENEFWYKNPELIRRLDALNQTAETDFLLKKVQYEAETVAFLEKLSGDEWRELARTCKGMTLRQEVFSVENPNIPIGEWSLQDLLPHSAASHNCHIRLHQPRILGTRYAVFSAHESEALTWQYEQNWQDPRIAHSLNVAFDKYGNTLLNTAVAYPRRAKFIDPTASLNLRTAQATTLITLTENRLTDDDFTKNGTPQYRLPQMAETRTYQLTRISKDAREFYEISDFDDVFNKTTPFAYNQSTAAEAATGRRLIEHVQTRYYNNELTGALPLGKASPQGLVYEAYQLAYSPDLLDNLFGNGVITEGVMTEAKYTRLPDATNWWIRSGIVQFGDLATAQRQFFSPIRFTDPAGATTQVSYGRDYFLFVETTEDALQNRTAVEQFNFRTLSPSTLRGVNDERSTVITDELGMVKAMAMLDGGDNLDGLTEVTDLAERNQCQTFLEAADRLTLDTVGKTLLGNASARFVYDLNVFDAHFYKPSSEIKPTVAAAIQRETHRIAENGVSTKWQFTFEYSNGFGAVAMKKIQAESGKALFWNNQTGQLEETATAVERWVGTGRTVLNNKGNAVKQYEPYFSTTPQYEPQMALVGIGVTPILYYDALNRLIKTDLSDGSFSKIEFDAWTRREFDQNDTLILRGQNGDILESNWYTARKNGGLNHLLKVAERERDAARQAAARSAETPSTLHFDTLGRVILHIAHNKNGAGESEFYTTEILLDIESNVHEVRDARGLAVMKYGYDWLGHRVRQESMDAGSRRMFNDAMGKPSRMFDGLGRIFTYRYDVLHRLMEALVSGGSVGVTPIVFEKIVYGENQNNGGLTDKQRFLRGKIWEHYDASGKTTFVKYDFKGNVLSSQRQLVSAYRQNNTPTNWAANPLLEAEIFNFSTVYDALNRVVSSTTPDGSVTAPQYNEANLLNSVRVNDTAFVTNIDYDARGQRTQISYGNGAITRYGYDEDTYRLLTLDTERNGKRLQKLRYTYDAVGNISHIEDAARPTIWFNNWHTEPLSTFHYDALYRLVEAKGREHGSAVAANAQDNWNDEVFKNSVNQNDAMAWRPYTQTYEYDAVGNILKMQHVTPVVAANWTRLYKYAADSNRLLETTVGGRTQTFPHQAEHGYMLEMPHLSRMDWDFKDQLAATAKRVAANPETTFYNYDSGGQRVRKVTDTEGGHKKDERIYLGSYEIYRKYDGTAAQTIETERYSLHVMDDTRRIALVETTVKEDSVVKNETLTRYQFANYLGTSCLEADQNGRVLSYEEYHPYGTTAYQATDASLKVPKRYRYTGMERDDETGLNYHSARYYVLWLGRWASSDPIGIEGGMNLYIYASSNPVNNIDLNGSDDYPAWYSAVTKETKDDAVIQERLQGLEAREESIRKLIALSGPQSHTDAHGDTYIVEGLNLDPEILKALGQEQSWISHAIGNLRSMQKINQRLREIDPVREQIEIVTGKKYEDFSQSARSYWRMKIGHPEWQLKTNAWMYMTGSIVEESQSTDVQIFQASMMAGIFGPLMSKRTPSPTSMPSPTSIVQKIFLPESEGVLAVIKDGKILASSRNTLMSHAEFVKRNIGTLPEGAEVVTIGKLDGQITALLSQGIHGRTLPASQAAIDAARNVYK